MDKKNMTYELRIKAIIDEAQKNLGTFEKQLKNTWENGAPPKHMSKSLEGIRARLVSLQEIAKKGAVDSSDLAMAESDYKAFAKTIHDLSIEFKLFTADQKKAMLSQEEQRAMAARTAAVREYNEELKKSREILEKRKTIEDAKSSLQETQKPARARAQASLEDYTKRKENLNKIGGPVLSPAAKEYANTLSEQSKLLDQIKEKESAVSSLRSRGLREDRENSLTKTIKELEELKAKQQAFESMAGKSEYDKSMLEYVESLEIVEKGIQDAKAEIASLDGELEVFDKQLSKLPVPNTKQALADLKKELKELGVEGIENAESIEEIEKAIEKLNGKALQRVDDNIAKTRKELELLGEQGKQAKKGIDQATQAMKEQEEAARQQEAFENKIKQFLGLAGAAQVMRSALRNAMATIKDLDATMTEMAVVTDLEIGDYWNQLDEHAERASELGRSINDVYKAETLYYQQGLKTNEVIALSTETMKMATIAGLDAEDATNKMTAALRGFNMELNETSAQRISDVYSELAAITAADVGEISSAMTKTASIASSAGMEFETTAAFLSQIIETTRESAETAGTAMKTVIARFQELKKDPAEIGEVDGEIVDANKIETALRTVGVALRDSSGQFRDLDDVFLELSSKWDTLDTNTQRYIATIAAGSRQQSRFIAMMSDYGRTQELVTAANNSAGASQKQFEKTIDSFQHKLNALKTAWEEFSMGILESDLVKFGVDMLTKFLEIINKATGAIDGLGGSIVKIMTVVALFKLGQKVFDKFKTPMMNFFTDLVGMTYNSGVKAGEAFAKGLEDSKKTQKQKDQEQLDEKANIAKSHEKTSASQAAKQAFGIDNLTTGAKNIASGAREEKAALNKMVFGDENNIPASKKEQKTAINKERKARIDRVKKAETKMNDWETGKKAIPKAKDNRSQNSKDYKAAKKELEEAKKALVEFDETEQAVQKKSTEGWAQVGSGLSQMGTTIASVGIGMSAIGGILDGLGLEAAGEGFAKVGNAVTLIGGGISAIGTALMAIPPILTIISAHPIIAIIVAICAVIIATIAIIATAVKNNSMEAKMNAAAEATEKAKEAAKQAKEAYDELAETRDGYDEMQKSLKELTYGTKEWKKALHEVNSQVLELVKTYPELAQYMGRGEQGELTIADEGWDALLEKQQKAVTATQNIAAYRQNQEQDLKMEQAKEKFNTTINNSTLAESGMAVQKTTTDSDGNTTTTYVSATEQLKEDLEDIYLVQGSSLDEQTEKAEELAKKYNMTTNELLKAANELDKASSEINAIAEQTENINRANLTAMASEEVLNNDLGTEAIDAFAASVGNSVEKGQVANLKGELKEGKDYRDSDEFKRIAKEYGVSGKLTGDDTYDLKTLYAATQGIDVKDVSDDLSRDAMLEAIAIADEGNKRNEKIEEYLSKLEQLQTKEGKNVAQNVAGLLSDDGRDMSADFARSMRENGEVSEAAVLEQAQKLGFDSIEDWAAALNKTSDELIDEIDANTAQAIKTNNQTFTRLQKTLGKTSEEANRFGKTANLTIESQANLVDKMIEVTQTSNQTVAGNINDLLGTALDSVGDRANDLAAALSGIDWQSVEDWDALQQTLEGMNLWNDSIKTFIEETKIAANAIEILSFDKVTEELQSIRDLVEQINNGSQGRNFDKDQYDLLINANADLAKDFVQLGDSFYYLGTSMEDLTNVLISKTVSNLHKAEQQLVQQSSLSQLIKDTNSTKIKSASGKDLTLDDGDYTKWSKEDKKTYIYGFLDNATKEVFDENGNLKEGKTEADLKALSYITGSNGKSLGMDYGMSLEFMSEKQINEMIQSIDKLGDITNEQWEEDIKKTSRDAKIAEYTMNSASVNYDMLQNPQNKEDQNEIARAFQIQAADSGMVAEAVISQYSALLEKRESGETLSEEENKQIKDLEASMDKSLDKIIYNQQGISDIIDLQNRVAEALYNKRQEEIDKLSQIDDSVNKANEQLVNKIQEQINDARQARENQKMEEEISNSQARMAYLMRDTSGANALEVQSLNKEITDKKENYGDTLIDQNLQKLSDDNQKAAEQRQKQIELMQATLDYDKENGNLTREAERIVSNSLNDINNKGIPAMETEMGNIIAEDAKWENLSREDAALELNKFLEVSRSAANAQAQLQKTAEDTEDNTGDVDDNITTKIDAVALNGLVGDIATQIGVEKENRQARNEAVSQAATLLKEGYATTSSAYQAQLQKYSQAGGSVDDFLGAAKGAGGAVRGNDYVVSPSSVSGAGTYEGDWDEGIYVEIDGEKFGPLRVKVKNDDTAADNSTVKSLLGIGDQSDKSVVYYNSRPYMLRDGKWHPMFGDSNDDATGNSYLNPLTEKLRSKRAYATGGLADFTGPAWLDGTKSHPELVLNARDTQNFILLKDILADILSDNKGNSKSGNGSSGDNYYDVQINVESIANDYDVEQMADKIRDLIYKDSIYRNVNAVNLIR